jgi:hypothetical protein
MSTDIHAITEIFDVVDVALADVKAALADGKVDWTDAMKFTNLWSPVKKALSDVTLAAAEAKGMDGDDVQVLLSRAVQVVTEVVAAVTPKAA